MISKNKKTKKEPISLGMKNNTINLVPSGHEVGIVTMVSGRNPGILFFISFYTYKK